VTWPILSLGTGLGKFSLRKSSALKMGGFELIVGLCFIAQGMAYTLFIPFMQGPYGYPWMGHRGIVPQVSPVVIQVETEFTCTTTGSFPDPQTCNKFYQCNQMPDGELKEFIFDCPPGLNFDADLKVCSYATGEDCRHQGPVESCAGLIGVVRTLCQERLGLQVSPVVIELETEFECTVAGTFADPNSCSKYYSCNKIDGKIESFLFDCPPTLLFNSVDGLCDKAESVTCAPEDQDIKIEVCSSPELTEEQRNLCQNNTWKQFDHFRK